MGYIEERSVLIPIAEKYADVNAGRQPRQGEKREDWANRWNRTFHNKMNELWENREVMLHEYATRNRLTSESL